MTTPLTEAAVEAAFTPELGMAIPAHVQARVACPETGGIKRVRLGCDPVLGEPTVVRCGRFGAGPVTCRMRCLIPLPPD